MTRINVVPVQELSRLHLQGEYKEITRVFALSRKAQFDVMKGKRKLPLEYTLGTGHVLFFYDKLLFICNRYEELCQEMKLRGYNPNQIPRDSLMDKISPMMYNDYQVTEEALRINRKRILERTK